MPIKKLETQITKLNRRDPNKYFKITQVALCQKVNLLNK